jgi:hypothetical protein
MGSMRVFAMSDLAHLVLEESFVLAICIRPYRIEIEMDFVLAPEHQLYVAPPPNERECFRKGRIRISDFSRLTWQASGAVASVDAEGQLDFGHLDQCIMDGSQVILRGDWGEIAATGGSLAVELEGPPLPPAKRGV